MDVTNLCNTIISCYTDVKLTGHIIHTNENKQIILNCTVSGIHNTSNVVEIRFNDDKLYSCIKSRWPNEPEGSIDKPHAHFMNKDIIICQLTIPNAAKADFVDYYCRVKLQLSSKTFNRNCYLLSKTVPMTPSEDAGTSLSDTDMMTTHVNNVSTVHLATIITVPIAIIVICLILLSIIPVRKAMKCCHHKSHYDYLPQLREQMITLGQFNGIYNAYTLYTQEFY